MDSQPLQSKLEQLALKTGDQDALLYVGDLQDSIPRMLITDQLIPSTAFRIWCFLRSKTHAQFEAVACPSYSNIKADLGIGSDQTIARSYSYLRIRRWLTLVGRRTSARGRNLGNIYALHSEPASMVETIELDAEYLSLINKCLTESEKSLQSLAKIVEAEIHSQQSAQEQARDVGRRMRFFDNQRLSAQKQTGLDQKADFDYRSTDSGENGPDFDYRSTDLEKREPDYENRSARPKNQSTDFDYRSTESGEKEPDFDNRSTDLEKRGPDYENRSARHLKNQSLCSRSSSLNKYSENKKTTTTESGEDNQTLIFEFYDQVLRWPNLAKEYAVTKLMLVDREWRQPVIDEIKLKLDKDPKSVKNPIGYLSWCVSQLQQGENPLVNYVDSIARKHQSKQTQKRQQEQREQSDKARLEQLEQQGINKNQHRGVQ